jgi:hypothetical protein
MVCISSVISMVVMLVSSAVNHGFEPQMVCISSVISMVGMLVSSSVNRGFEPPDADHLRLEATIYCTRDRHANH